MEAMLKSSPERTKERLLTFLLVFLVLLVPVTILSERSTSVVELNDVFSERINDTAEKMYFKMTNKVNDELTCKLMVEYYVDERLTNQEVHNFGNIGPRQTKVGFAILHFPAEDSTFEINPECFKTPS